MCTNLAALKCPILLPMLFTLIIFSQAIFLILRRRRQDYTLLLPQSITNHPRLSHWCGRAQSISVGSGHDDVELGNVRRESEVARMHMETAHDEDLFVVESNSESNTTFEAGDDVDMMEAEVFQVSDMADAWRAEVAKMHMETAGDEELFVVGSDSDSDEDV